MTRRLSALPFHPTSTALASALLALAGGHAVAQAPAPAADAASAAPASTPASADATTLPAVRVRSSAETENATGPVPGYTARRSATATRTDTPLNEVPQSITVIGAEQVRDQNSLTMQEVLRYTPGVRAEMYGLDNRGDYYGLRGGSDGSNLLDGLRLPLTGYWAAVRNEPYAFERIEVLRGPSSLIAGQNGPGGVVNLVSKRPLFEPQREVQVQLGNHAHKQIAADLSGPATDDGRLAYRLVALRKDSGSQVDHADQERTFVAPSLTWKPLAGTTLTVYGEYQKDKSLNENGFFPVAGTLNEAPNGRIPYDTFIGEPDWDTYGGTRKRFGWELAQTLSSQWTLRHRFRRDSVDGHLATAYAAWWLGFADASGAPDANGTYLNRIGYVADDRSRISNADLLLEGKLDFGRTKHTLVTGVDYMSHRMVHDDFGVFGEFEMSPLDVYNPVYGTSPLPQLPLWDTVDTQTRNVGLLLQDQVKFDDRWVIVAGLRHDRARSNTATAYTAFAESQGQEDSRDSSRDSANSKNLGVVYLADGGVSPYLGYSESFEPMAGNFAPERGGGAFKPKRGKQLEAGVKWMPAHSRVSASAAIYRLKETNRLATDPDYVNQSIQVGEATVDGVELDTTASLADWDFLANYSYTHARLTGATDDNRGEQLSSIPKHSAAAWAVYRFGALGLPGLRAGGGVRYAGPSWDGAGNNRVPSVTLVDLLVGYETGPWSVSLNVNNLADRTYIATCLSRGDCWFDTKRRAVATLAYRW